jgi:transcriptional regulator with XRE-family HTH domain
MSRTKSRNTDPPKTVSPERTERLKKLIDQTGLSQKKFAEAVEISETNLSEVLNGRTGVTILLAERIRDRFGVDPSWLLFGPEPKEGRQEVRFAREVTAFLTLMSERHGPVWHEASVDDLENGEIVAFEIKEEAKTIRRLGRVGTLEDVRFVGSLTRPGDAPIPLHSGRVLKVWRLRGVAWL